MNRVQAAMRTLVFGVPEPERVESVFDDPGDDPLTGVIPDASPLEGDEAQKDVREVAMSLLDPDVYGYLVIRVVREFHGPNANVAIRGALHPTFWPAVRETLVRLLVAYESRA